MLGHEYRASRCALRDYSSSLQKSFTCTSLRSCFPKDKFSSKQRGTHSRSRNVSRISLLKVTAEGRPSDYQLGMASSRRVQSVRSHGFLEVDLRVDMLFEDPDAINDEEHEGHRGEGAVAETEDEAIDDEREELQDNYDDEAAEDPPPPYVHARTCSISPYSLPPPTLAYGPRQPRGLRYAPRPAHHGGSASRNSRRTLRAARREEAGASPVYDQTQEDVHDSRRDLERGAAAAPRGAHRTAGRCGIGETAFVIIEICAALFFGGMILGAIVWAIYATVADDSG